MTMIYLTFLGGWGTLMKSTLPTKEKKEGLLDPHDFSSLAQGTEIHIPQDLDSASCTTAFVEPF